MGFESRAISARVTKQIVTFFSKTCDKSYLLNFCLQRGQIQDPVIIMIMLFLNEI